MFPLPSVALRTHIVVMFHFHTPSDTPNTDHEDNVRNETGKSYICYDRGPCSYYRAGRASIGYILFLVSCHLFFLVACLCCHNLSLSNTTRFHDVKILLRLVSSLLPPRFQFTMKLVRYKALVCFLSDICESVPTN